MTKPIEVTKEDFEELDKLLKKFTGQGDEPEELFPLPDKAIDFLSQIMDAYPIEDAITLRKVISVGKVLYQDSPIGVGLPITAAVVNSRPYTLLFGKRFMATNMKTIFDCVYILAHELTHLVLDHFASDLCKEFKDFELSDYAVNIVLDCQVNATVYHSLREDKYFEFIKRFYKQDEMPFCFFRNDGVVPDDWKDALQPVHDKLYSEAGITNKELVEALMPWFEQQDKKTLKKIKQCLLGNHADTFKNRTGNASSEELEDLAKAVGQNYLNKKKKNEEEKQQGGGGEEEKEAKGEKEEGEGKGEGGKDPAKDGNPGDQPGKGGMLRDRLIEVSLDLLESARELRKKLRRKDVVSPSARIFKAIEGYVPKKPLRSVIPNFRDRRTVAMFSRGTMPVFHKTPYTDAKVCVPCYLDVSSSQDHVIPYTLPVVSKLKQVIGNVVYCFSTLISEASCDELRKGKYQTTGGTDFDPVIEHILKNKFKRAVILTDGQARLDPRLAALVRSKKIDITVGWTQNNPNFEPLQSIASKTFFIFKD